MKINAKSAHRIGSLEVAICRAAVALVWFYQGLVSKVLTPSFRQLEVISRVPGFGMHARGLLLSIGILETALAIWVLSGRRSRAAAIVQILTLSLMNFAGLLCAPDVIPDPAGMVVTNIAFLTLAWIASSPRQEVIR